MRQSRREKAARMKKEAEEKKKIIRDALAAFFVGAALVIGHRVHWFTIRGDNELGLQLLTMLSVDEYATALLLGGLVNVTNNRQSAGGYIVKTSDTSYWTPFLNEYQGEQEGELNLRDVAEATHTQVKAETFKHQHQGTKIGDTLHGLHLLRLGKYRKGETTKPSLQLTDYVEPPSCKSRQIRALQDRLLKAVSPVIKSIRPKTEQFKKAEAVAEWVRMPELEEDIATYATSDRARKSTAFWKEEENAQKKTSDVSTKTPEPEPQDMNKPANEKNPKVSTHGKLIDEPSTKCSSTNHKIAHAGIADTNNIDSSFMNKTSASYPSKQVQSSVQIVQPGDSTNMEKGSGSHKDVQYLIPTPKATKKLIYPPEHKFAKFKTLNSLNMDVMNDTEGIEGMAATCNRQGLMREMFNYCEEHLHPEWQQGGYDVSTLLWDIEQLKAQAEKSNTASGMDRKGVREEPYFDIPVERYIWPVLHTLIGVGNGILNHLVDIVESEIQAVPAKEILLKREVRELTRDIIALRKERDDFDSNDEGSGKETLKYLKKERTRMMKRMETIEDEHMGEGYTSDIDEEYVGLSLGLEDCKEEIERLTKEREDMASSIDRMGTKKTAKNKQLEEFRKARKTDDDSLYSLIDEILQEYGILRAAYHGGDLTGVCVRRLMTYSEEIMDSIAALLVDNKSPQCTMSDDNIRSLCENCSKLLTRWDGALHYLHEDNTEENCENATKFIDSALELSRSMGISVLPKHHGTEAHLVKQMRDVKGGLFEFDESWTEQYHQIGYQFDIKLRNKSERKKAEVRAANDRRINLPQSQAAKKKLDELKRGQRKTTQMKEADEKLKKKQRRENAL